jgi:hypothetical protein
MASNINPYNIDGTFPVANQDNPSQGFRDNFTNTRNNFIYAASEISDLQAKAVVTSALNGQTITNDMAGTQLRRPQLAAWTQSLIDLGAVTGTAVLDFNQANFQKITTAGPVSLSFINWPASTGSGALGYGLMRVWIDVTDIAHTVELPPSVDIAISDLAGHAGDGLLTFDQPGNYIFDFSSIDGGANYLVFDVTRNRASFRDPSIYYNPTMTSTFMLGFGPALTYALALEAGQNAVAVNGSMNAVGAGNLSLANINNSTLDTGHVGGYTITGIRGNLSANLFLPVQSNDYLGYVNAVDLTGYNGTSNTFQQTASMVFYATGSNVTYGLGGNIAFYTKPDGGESPQGIYSVDQALGLENDQSARFFGNVILSTTGIPLHSNSSGVAGQIAWDSNYFYVCTATDTWARVAYTSTSW